MVYQFFKKHNSNPMIATIAYAVWSLRCRWNARRPEMPPAYSDGKAAVKVGLICDQMTYEDFKQECAVIYITPRNWRTVLRKFPPDLLLCESAWNGIEECGNCWRGQIYRNHSVLFEHRKVLFDIVDVCRQQRIPTVFWNKEDPSFFGNLQYDFADTALRFDYIFTTAAECIPKYQAMGHQHVHLLRFGFSPRLFNPLGSGQMENAAFFAGSWYQDQPERCRDMEALFQYAERWGIPYTIYDRNFGARATLNRFPEKYRGRIQPAVPFSQLNRTTKHYLYALNINTVKASETMFARRVYEMMAENHVILSNRAKGLEREFPDSVWYCDQAGPPAGLREKRRRNLEYVFEHHTWEKRLDTILRVLNMADAKPPVLLYVFLAEECADPPCADTSANICVEYHCLAEEKIPAFHMRRNTYAAVLRGSDSLPEIKWDFLLAQFAYLPPGCGVRWGKASYEIAEDADNWNCVFPVDVLGIGFEHFHNSLKKLEL